MFEYQAEAITRKSFNFEAEAFNGCCENINYSTLESKSKYVYQQDDDYAVPVIPYESAWECYGGLTEEESWAELYAELND